MADSRLLRVLYVAACAMFMAMSVALAQDTGPDKPLLVIRFNQPNVYFLNSLDLAVIKAKTAKPGVKFNVVSYVPQGSTAGNTERANVGAVVQEMRSLGVASSQIAYSTQPQPALPHQEIHIFVE